MNLKNIKLTEKQIEKLILDHLSFMRGGFVTKVELGGRPVNSGGRKVIIGFKNKYYRKGFSDIMFNYKGKVFYFEVKTPEEYNWYEKKKEKLRATPLTMLKSKKEIHFKEQQLFIDGVRRGGSVGEFVCSLNQVRNIIEHYCK